MEKRETMRWHRGEIENRSAHTPGGRMGAVLLLLAGGLLGPGCATLGADAHHYQRLDRAALQRSWSGPIKISAIGQGLWAAAFLIDGRAENNSRAGIFALGAVISTLIAIGLDSLARTNVADAIGHRGRAGLRSVRPSRTAIDETPWVYAPPPRGPASAPGTANVADTTWYILRDGQEIGPLTHEALRAMIQEGRVNRNTIVRRAAGGAWGPAGEQATLF